MVGAHDVAAYILKKRGPMTAMKLQKLVYYAQAWSLVWDDKPLFGEKIEAWANGPVVLELYERHRGIFRVNKWDGNPDALSDEEKDTVDKVLEFYGRMSSQQLSDLTHREGPWQEARSPLGFNQRGHEEITHAAMAEYYDKVIHQTSLGVTQKGRVFGILEHNVLKLLWWDPNHEVCPMEKPNT